MDPVFPGRKKSMWYSKDGAWSSTQGKCQEPMVSVKLYTLTQTKNPTPCIIKSLWVFILPGVSVSTSLPILISIIELTESLRMPTNLLASLIILDVNTQAYKTIVHPNLNMYLLDGVYIHSLTVIKLIWYNAEPFDGLSIVTLHMTL